MQKDAQTKQKTVAPPPKKLVNPFEQKAKDAETRVGSKTAWMGTYYNEKGEEKEVTGWKIKLPDDTHVPQVRAYKYLGTPMQIEWKGRHDAMRSKVVGACCGLLRPSLSPAREVLCDSWRV